MRIVKYPKIMPVLSLSLLLLGISPATFAASANLDWLVDTNSTAQRLNLLILAEAENNESGEEEPRSGSLVLPADEDKEKLRSGALVLPLNADDNESEKKCLTVCQRWGQDCVYDNRRGRKCRRTCKEFGQECF